MKNECWSQCEKLPVNPKVTNSAISFNLVVVNLWRLILCKPAVINTVKLANTSVHQGCKDERGLNEVILFTFSWNCGYLIPLPLWFFYDCTVRRVAGNWKISDSFWYSEYELVPVPLGNSFKKCRYCSMFDCMSDCLLIPPRMNVNLFIHCKRCKLRLLTFYYHSALI
jgi:hypothetical protein